MCNVYKFGRLINFVNVNTVVKKFYFECCSRSYRCIHNIPSVKTQKSNRYKMIVSTLGVKK